MRVYFVIIICFWSKPIYAQELDTAYYKLIYSEIRRIQDSGIVYYSDKPGKEVYAGFLKQMPSALGDLTKRGLDLSKREKDAVFKQLQIIANSFQPNDLFPLSKRISSDTIVSFVENQLKIVIDSIRTLPDKTFTSSYYFKKLPWAFFFTKPIYLRDSTICFSYFMYYRNSAGEHGLRVYKKQSGNWVKIAIIGGGAW